MKQLKPLLLLFCLTLCGIMAGCERAPAADPSLSAMIGKNVVVQFRRDALGAAAPLPISPTTGSINGAKTLISGTLAGVRPDAVLIKDGNGTKWIPREVILFVEFCP